MVSKGEKKTEKKQARATPAKQRVLDENQVLSMPQVVAWRLMIKRLELSTKQLHDVCKEQNEDLPSAERTPYPRNQKQKDFKYHDVLTRHLVVTMHDVGFENARLLRDKDYVAKQTYCMLWREAVFRGIRPVANRELLYARMFPESENGIALPRMKTIADVPTPGHCNGHVWCSQEQRAPSARGQTRKKTRRRTR